MVGFSTEARGTADAIESTPPAEMKKQTKAGNLVDWLGDNAKQVDPVTVETKLKTDFPVLLQDEKVELAFQSGRGTFRYCVRKRMTCQSGIPFVSFSDSQLSTNPSYFGTLTGQISRCLLISASFLWMSRVSQQRKCVQIFAFVSSPNYPAHQCDTTSFFGILTGLIGKKVEYLTVPYSSIHGFSVQTAGALLDRDTELVLFTNMLGDLYQIKQDFRATKVNLWALQKCLCNHVLGTDQQPLPGVNNYQGHQDPEAGLFGIISGLRFDQRPIDAVRLNAVLHSDPPILQGMEQVEMAFQGYRDITVFTTKRVITIDKKGLIGKKIEYFSVPWEKLVAFGVRKAGFAIDFDTEVQLYTEFNFYPGDPGDDNSPPIPARPELSCLELDFNKNCVDLMALKYYLTRRIMDISHLERGAPIGLEALTFASPDPKGFERLFQWLGSDQREIDPAELDAEFHHGTKILLDNEKVLMAFKAGRDGGYCLAFFYFFFRN
jgi:hypothetical protein